MEFIGIRAKNDPFVRPCECRFGPTSQKSGVRRLSLSGVEVRPIKALDGIYHTCDVFYDNVPIPLANVVGELDNGWSVVMTTFGFERGVRKFNRCGRWCT